jgi:glucokinase
VNAVGVDVGGTKIAAGVVTPEGKILDEVRYPTPHLPGTLIETIARAISEVGDGPEIGGVCLAVPGLILAQENKVIFSPNLRAVEGIPLKEKLEPKIGMPLTIENDGNAAAWGEFRFGVGSEADHLVFVTLGTGIGGGVITHGILMRGAQGSGGELGHVTIQATGPRCACGNHGCLEALASGTAIGRRARELAVEHPDSALGRLATRRQILGEDVTELAREGDEVALSALDETGRWLGVGLAGFVNTLKVATLGPESGVLGAAALARDASSGEYLLGG